MIDGNHLFVELKGALTGQFPCQKLKTVQDYKFITIQMIECLVKLIFGRYIRFDCFNRGKAKSLKTYYEKFKPDPRTCTLMEDYKKEDWLVNIPLYMIEEIANL